MTETFTCWRCGATRRLGDSHCCGRAARASSPRRRWRPRPVGSAAVAMFIGLVVWIAAWLVHRGADLGTVEVRVSSTSHIFVLDSHHPDGKPDCYTLRCDNCGTKASVRLPIAISEFVGITNGFTERHRACSVVEPVEKPAGGGA